MPRTRTKPAKTSATRAAPPDVLAPAWCAWIAENLVGGVRGDRLVRELVAHGVPRQMATSAVREIRPSPALHGVAAATQRARSLDALVRLRRELDATRAPRTIERRAKPTATEFFDRYWAGNEPVVLTDAAARWKLWTPRDMKRLLGGVTIEVTDGRNGDPFYDERYKAHSKKTTIGAFVDRVLAAGETNDFYMVANNRTMERPELGKLLRRIVLDTDLFDPTRLKGGTSLWLGPKGTVTPLHHDTTNILFFQIFGRKQFLLAAPHHAAVLKAARGFYVDLDPEAPDLERHPWWADVKLHRVVLEPGEALFLPVGWWHHVRSLDVSISLSLLNFRRPNNFPWYRPGFKSLENVEDAPLDHD